MPAIPTSWSRPWGKCPVIPMGQCRSAALCNRQGASGHGRPRLAITRSVQTPQLLWGKRVELLTELLGRLPQRLGFLGNPGNVAFGTNWRDAQESAAKAGADLKRGARPHSSAAWTARPCEIGLA